MAFDLFTCTMLYFINKKILVPKISNAFYRRYYQRLLLEEMILMENKNLLLPSKNNFRISSDKISSAPVKTYDRSFRVLFLPSVTCRGLHNASKVRKIKLIRFLIVKLVHQVQVPDLA